MNGAGAILRKLLHPPKVVLCVVPPAVFAALIYIFAANQTESAAAYPIYFMSAYSLVIWLAAVPKLTRRVKSAVMSSRPVQKVLATRLGKRYLCDIAFRGSVGLCQGMAANFGYALFRIVVGIRYMSVWFVSMAIYYFALGGLRAYLVFGYSHRGAYGLSYEYRCYRRTAWMLFLLHIPMGGMIALMVRTNSGFSYPGYVIYLSALYTFYTATVSVINLVRFSKLGSPILSAAKILNFVSAMMSILGLQTAMIARFSSGGEEYRRFMNTVTGSFVYGVAVVLAVYMLIHDAVIRRKWNSHERSPKQIF